MINNKNSQLVKPPERGCSSTLIIVAVCLFIFVLTAGFLISTALVWEFEFEGYFSSMWARAAIQVGYSAGLLSLLGPLAIWWKSQPFRRHFRTLAFAAVYSAILSISRIGWITNAQLTAVLEIGLSLVFLVILVIISRRRQVNLKEWLLPTSPAHWMLPLLLIGIYALIWMGIGAFGSWIDSLLNLISGICFGLTASVLLRLGVFTGSMHQPEDNSQLETQGLVISVMLAIMLAGLAPNGLQYSLIIIIPSLGWLIPILTSSSTEVSGIRSGFSSALTVGLAVAIPFMLVDPDELALVITASKGELLGWVAIASLVSFIIIGIEFFILL